MIKFFTGVLSAAVIFAISLLVSLITSFILEKIKETSPKPEEEKPKIYYIKNIIKEKKKRKAPRKKADVALKGIVINAEEFEKAKDKL